MKYKISAKNDSVVNAGITTDYRQAIVEYIWNGFDANAQTVRIDRLMKLDVLRLCLKICPIKTV